MRSMTIKTLLAAASLLLACSVQAQSTPKLPTSGSLVVVPAFGEVTVPNDQATVYFNIEEQDKDKAAAASRVNQKMKAGTDIVRREDPQAQLKTQGYYSYPVYADEQPPRPMEGRAGPKTRQLIGWRVGQSLEVKTTNLAGLQRMVASTQKTLALGGLNFGLSPAAAKKLDEQRIAATYRNLNERVAAIAAAMGRPLADATLELIDFEGSGHYAGGRPEMADTMQAKGMRAMAAPAAAQEVAEPSFEPGETTLQMQVVGKVRFK
jgi:predicted secreted protein